MAVWQYGSMAVWQSGGMAVWQYGGMAVWRYGGMAVWQYGGMAVWQYGSMAVWQYPQIGMSRQTKLKEKEGTRFTTVEHEMCDRSHRSSKTRFIETFGSHSRKICRRVTTKGSCTWNITGSAAVWNWKRGSPLVQEKYR
jgi:hypothetical protein